MNRDTLTPRDSIFILFLFVISSSIILGFPDKTGQETWISLLLAGVMLLPLLAVYLRLTQLMPQCNIFEMAEFVFGKILGRACIFCFGVYCLLIATMTLSNYSEFVRMTALVKTPYPIVAFLLFFCSLYLVKSGLCVIGKFSFLVAVISFLTLFFISTISIPFIQPENLLPLGEHSAAEIMQTAGVALTVPMGECVIFLALLRGGEAKGRMKHILFIGGSIGVFVLVIIFVRTCGILGAKMMSTIYFPVYKSVSLIRVGSFLSRFEIFVAIAFTLSGVTKTACCCVAATKAFAAIWSTRDYQVFSFPVTFSMLAFSVIIFRSMLEMLDFFPVLTVLSVPFQIIFPVILWLCAEVKCRGLRTRRRARIPAK